MIRSLRAFSVSVLSLALAGLSLAELHPQAPQLSSNANAKYTLYLDFSGFNYDGQWGNTGRTPGNVPAYTTDGDNSTFNTAEKTAITNTWARYVNAYAGFNINVTTVDPAAAGLADAQRQSFYDQKQYMMHTVLGGTYNWYGSSGGVSYVATAQNANVLTGRHTNWVFPVNGSGTSDKGMAAAGIHEDGHGLSLNHQHDEHKLAINPNDPNGEYSSNNNSNGNGSYGPLMGTTYNSQRGTWRVGAAKYGDANDVAVLESNGAMGPLLDDNIGHSFATATSLAVAGSSVDVTSSRSKGFIMPKSSAGYSAGSGVGDEDVYTKDYYSFRAAGGAVTLVAHDGNSLLQAGVADPGATMRAVMRIYDKNHNLVGTATEDTSTLVHTWSGTLATGDYFAQIVSYGAFVSAYEPDSRYFNMGGYFLTGSGLAQPVPEPASLIAIAAGVGALLRRRRGGTAPQARAGPDRGRQ